MYLNVETPTGTLALKKTSEDGVVAGIQFTIKGEGIEIDGVKYDNKDFIRRMKHNKISYAPA